MNKALKNKKIAVLLFCAVTGLLFSACHTIEETVSPKDLYDYGARYYDPAMLRFSIIDPMVEKYPTISPYAYQITHPIYVDLKEDSIGNTLPALDVMRKDKTPTSQNEEQ